jgi:hypothetical protein
LRGFTANPQLEVRHFFLHPRQIALGEAIQFSFELHATCDTEQSLVIDYVLHFRKASGKQAPKVFKLTEKILAPDTPIRIQKRHTIKAITTRAYYPGTQRLEIQINGQAMGSHAFELIF